MIFTDQPIGKVIHYYDQLGVAIIDLTQGELRVGDEVKFKKGEEGFTQKIESLQVDHQTVDSVKTGDSFGLKVDQEVTEGTQVYK